MVSRRNFLNMLIMMAVLLFMFQFSQVIKENGNKYDVNEFVTQNRLSGANQWSSDMADNTGGAIAGKIVLVGDADSSMADAVSQWCIYSKRSIEVLEDVHTYDLNSEEKPELILLDSALVDYKTQTGEIADILESGVTVVFCGLPEPELFESNLLIRDILGVKQVKAQSVETEGIHIFEGFLLGGEIVYKAQTEEEQKFQDLELDMPWYVLGKGTKSYAVGLLDYTQYEYEEFPELIWRNSYGDAMVFAINGDYMSDLTAMGILDAIIYEKDGYSIHPVVNAQNVVLADFPKLSPENAAEIERIYSRNPQAVLRDIIWPGIVSMAKTDNLKLTCLFSTKYSYEDSAVPSGSDVQFYLQQMKEIDAEAGVSLVHDESVSSEQKLQYDKEFYEGLELGYEMASAYTDSLNEELQEVLKQGELLENTGTIAFRESEDLPLLSYFSDDITLQKVTTEAEEYTYAKDLQMRSLVSALGYSNVLINMNNVIWPESVKEQWQNYSEEIFSNIHTYWTRYDGFTYTTLSESDAKVRALLNLNYRYGREADIIRLQLVGNEKGAYFVLRLHNEQIAQVKNAEYTELEKNVYLLHTAAKNVEIYVEKDEDILQYKGVYNFN